MTMFTGSSKDYFSGEILITFEGGIPTYEEVNEYCHKNYGFYPNFDYEIEPENNFRGYINPGIVVVGPQIG